MIAINTRDLISRPAETEYSLTWFVVRRMLPHRGPMAMLDGVERYNPEKGEVLAYKLVPGNDPTVNGHDPDDPALRNPCWSKRVGAIMRAFDERSIRA